MALKHLSLALLLALASSIAIVATANYEPTYQAQYPNVDHSTYESTPSPYEPKREEGAHGVEPKAYSEKPTVEPTYKYEENTHQVSYDHQVHEVVPKKEEKEEKPKKPLIDVHVDLPNNEKPEKVEEELKKTSHEVPKKEEEFQHESYVPKQSIEKPTKEYTVPVPKYNAKPEEVHPIEKSPETPKVYYEKNNEKGVEYTSHEQKPNTEKPVEETKRYKYEEAKPAETPKDMQEMVMNLNPMRRRSRLPSKSPKRVLMRKFMKSLRKKRRHKRSQRAQISPSHTLIYAPENNNIEKPYEYAPGHVEETKQECTNVAIQGIVYCRSGSELTRLEGAVTRVTCLHLHKDGYELAPFSVLSKPTDNKGYFYITVPQNEGISKISDCRVFLNSSPSETCNVPTDVNNGVSGAVPGAYQVLPNKKTELYTVGPFFYTTHPYNGAVPGAYQLLHNKNTELYTVGPFFYTTIQPSSGGY
ncbi:hypothetical protein Scep_008970 [Stephania cephalantha]|uniref:Pollen Ole e 1 allergen and extensin family protein n=1 Tax=Stephania cephalantha TaxID=152367 RepID=A0AAP0JSU1_9MAGN